MRLKTRPLKAGEPEHVQLRADDDQPLINFPALLVEELRYLIARASSQGDFPRRLSLVAALRQEGVTYLSRAVAATLAQDLRARVCAVELNWHWPSPLPVGAQPGLAAVLEGSAKLDQALLHTTDANLDFLPAGTAPVSQRSVLARSQRLADTLDMLSRRFDILILDVPAVRATSDAVPLAALGTAGCLVVNQGITPMATAQQVLRDISRPPMLGVIMNRMKRRTPAAVLKFIPEG